MSGAVSHLENQPVIRANGLGKTYGEEARAGLLSLFAPQRAGKRKQPVVALRDVSLEFHPGRIYGVIGANGAGKTTLLRILGRVLPPSAGRVVGRGRTAGLFGAGQFVDASQTGRANIYIQARLLGWRDRDIAPRVAEIADFAGLNRFIDVKVARYSKGMQLRLNFSIAANLKPDLLLLDDVLAVGDRAFQARALSRLRALAEEGASIVIVSHDMSHITQLCDEAIFLQAGAVARTGSPEEVAPAYLSSVFSARSKDFGPRALNDMGRIFELNLYDQHRKPVKLMTDEKDLIVEIGYFALQAAENTRAGVGVYSDGRLLFISEQNFDTRGRTGPIHFSVLIPRALMSRRDYALNVSVRPARGNVLSLLKVAPAAVFRVLDSRIESENADVASGALFRTTFPWSIRPAA
ncbi:MAG: ABC transporter ATP-binding protein [Parvularculaceae bacterium]